MRAIHPRVKVILLTIYAEAGYAYKTCCQMYPASVSTFTILMRDIEGIERVILILETRYLISGVAIVHDSSSYSNYLVLLD